MSIEPDSCYSFHPEPSKQRRPDLAIEVVVTSGGIDRLEIYRRIGVPEVWFWMEHEILSYVLGTNGYEQQQKSALIPALDFRILLDSLDQERSSDVRKKFNAELAKRRS